MELLQTVVVYSVQLKHLHDNFTVQHLIDHLNLICRLFLLLILKKNMESNGDKAFIQILLMVIKDIRTREDDQDWTV